MQQTEAKLSGNSLILQLSHCEKWAKSIIQSPNLQFESVPFVHWQCSPKNRYTASTMSNRMPKTALKSGHLQNFKLLSRHSVKIIRIWHRRGTLLSESFTIKSANKNHFCQRIVLTVLSNSLTSWRINQMNAFQPPACCCQLRTHTSDRITAFCLQMKHS